MALWAIVGGLVGLQMILDARKRSAKSWAERVSAAYTKILDASGQDYEQAIAHVKSELESYVKARREACKAKDRITEHNYSVQIRVLTSVRDSPKLVLVKQTEEY